MLLASEFDKSKYLSAANLESERKFRIKNCSKEIVGSGDDKEVKLVVWFTNEDRGLVLNKTNRTVLRDAFGDDTAAWAGKIIIVYPDTTPFGNKIVPCLRVRIPPLKQAAGNGQQTAAKAKPTTTAQTLDAFGDAPAAAKPAAKPPIEDDLDDAIPF